MHSYEKECLPTMHSSILHTIECTIYFCHVIFNCFDVHDGQLLFKIVSKFDVLATCTSKHYILRMHSSDEFIFVHGIIKDLYMSNDVWDACMLSSSSWFISLGKMCFLEEVWSMAKNLENEHVFLGELWYYLFLCLMHPHQYFWMGTPTHLYSSPSFS